MHRTVLILLVTTIILSTHSLAHPQQPKKIFRIGYLTVSSLSAEASRLAAFRQGLRELGYVEGQNLAIDQRSAAGMYERLPDLAIELVGRKMDLILSGGTSATRAAQTATNKIPIIMATSTDDPVTSGFVVSLARPGGNITGLTSIARELSGKRLELLKETVVKASRVAVLWNPNNPGHQLRLKEIEVVARALGISLQPVAVKSIEDLENAFRAAGSGPSNAVMISADALFNSHRKLLADLAVKNRLATSFDRDDFVEVGGLMSYGVDVDDLYRRAASFADKILKGATPGGLPIEEPMKFGLVINLKTAKQIGLTIPPNVLARADRVIK